MINSKVYSPVCSPVCSPVHGSVLGHFPLSLVAASIKRYYTSLDSVLQNYWEVEKPLILAKGDFIDITYLAPSAILSGTQYFCAGSVSETGMQMGMGSSGNFAHSTSNTIALDGVLLAPASPYPVDGKFHTLRFTNTSSITRLIGLIGKGRYGYHYNGILAAVVANIGGVTQTFPLSKGKGSINDTEYTLDNTFGAERATVTASVTITGAYTETMLTGSLPISIGGLYAYEYKLVSAPIGGKCRIRSLQGSGGEYAAIGSTILGHGIADNTSIRIQGSIAGDYTLELVSVKEVIGNAITRYAVIDDNVNKMTLVDGKWYGPNLWLTGDVIADGSENGAYSIIQFSGNSVVESSTYHLSYNCTVTFGRLQIICGNTGESYRPADSGDVDYTQTAILGTSLKVRNLVSNSVGAFTKISVKRIIEVAP